MILSVGNTLIGNTIGIAPKPMYVIYLLSVLASFPLTALRANMIDNSKNKKGKYRPYIFTMAIPTVILAMGFTWMPYDRMTMLQKCITVLLYNIGFQFFYMLMFDSYNNLTNVLSPNTYISLSDAKAMSKGTNEERKIRAYAIEKAKEEIESKKAIEKYYPNGLTEFDNSVFEKLFSLDDETAEKLRNAYIDLDKAKKPNQSERVNEIKEEIKHLKREKVRIKNVVKQKTNELSHFNKAAKPYLDARKLLIQKENYAHYEEIKERYEESKVRAERERIEKLKAEEREREEKKIYAAKLREERKNRNKK